MLFLFCYSGWLQNQGWQGGWSNSEVGATAEVSTFGWRKVFCSSKEIGKQQGSHAPLG